MVDGWSNLPGRPLEREQSAAEPNIPMAKITNFSRAVTHLLSSCPSAGEGVHAWLFKCAAALHRAGCTESEMIQLISDAASGCGRGLDAHEIPDAIRNSRPEAGAVRSAVAKAPVGPRVQIGRWPKPNTERLESILSSPDALGLVDLWERSPMRFDDKDFRTEVLIDLLFPGNPLLCCGWRNNKVGTVTREEWRGMMCDLPLIVPNPMKAEEGRRKSDGQLSPRTLENTGPRRFLAVEFDDRRGEDSQAARLWHLSSFSPLVLAVHSGGKSLHGWFCTHGDAEGGWHKFMRYAVSIGADPATWTRCQLVRMPDGLRREPGKERRQTVYYFNPEALPC